MLRQLVIDEPDSFENHHDLGLALIQVGEIKPAMESFKQSVKINPKHAQSHYNLGYCYQKLGFIDSAIYSYEDTISLNPEDDQAWCNLGTLFLKRNELSNAIHCFQKSTDVNPQNIELWKNLGNAQYLTGLYSESIASMEKALALDNSDVFCLKLAGHSYYSTGLLEDSIKAFLKALDMDAECENTWNNLGNSFLENQQYKEAEAAYRKALEINPQNTDFWYNLGELLFNHGSKKEAATCFAKVVAANQTDIEALEYLVNSQFDYFPYQALKNLEKLIDIKGESAEYLKMAAMLYAMSNQQEKEIKIRFRLASANPFDTENNRKIAEANLTRGDLESAYKFLSTNTTISKDDDQLWFRMAQGFQLKGKINEEFNCLKKTIQARQDHYHAWLRLGLIALEQQIPDKAYQYFTNASPILINKINLWKNTADRLMDIGEYDLAFSCCDRLIPSVTYTPKIWLRLFAKFQQKKQMESFANRLLKTLSSDVIKIETALGFGKLFLFSGHSQYSKTLYENLHSKEPENIQIINQQAQYYLKADQPDKAKAIVLQGLESCPDNYSLLNTQSEVAMLLDELDEAENCLHRALDLRQDDYQVWQNLGRVKYLKNQNEQALSYYTKSLSILDTLSETWYGKGLVEECCQRQEEAKTSYLAAVQIDRRNFQAWQALGVLALKNEKFKTAKKYFLKSLASNRQYLPAWESLIDVFECLKETEKAQSCKEYMTTLKNSA